MRPEAAPEGGRGAAEAEEDGVCDQLRAPPHWLLSAREGNRGGFGGLPAWAEDGGLVLRVVGWE